MLTSSEPDPISFHVKAMDARVGRVFGVEKVADCGIIACENN